MLVTGELKKEKISDRCWRQSPESNGMFWFCERIEDRDIATVVGIERIDYGNGETFLQTSIGSKRITPFDGWWLKINDERRTAAVIGKDSSMAAPAQPA